MAASINIPVYSDALVALGTAGIVVPMVHRFGFSPILGYLGAGALLGPLGLGAFIGTVPFLYWVTIGDAKNVSGIADLGVVFLLFLIGLELTFERLMAMRRLVLGLGGLQVAITTLALAAILVTAGFKPPVALVLGSCLALSSTAIVIDLLSGQGRMSGGTGRASFAILLAQDLAVIPLLMFVSVLGADRAGSIWSTAGQALLNALAAVTVIVIVGRAVMRPLFRLVVRTQSDELFIATILFVIVGTGVVAAVANLSMALGAFVAGLLLGETEYRKSIEATIEPFKGLLLGLFFFTIGMSIDVREIIRAPGLFFACVVGLIVVKAAILLLLCRLFKLSWPTSLETSLLLGPGGEFAFVGVGLASATGTIPADQASFIYAVTALTMALIPGLGHLAQSIKKKAPVAASIDPSLLVGPQATNRQAIVVGHGRVGKVVCKLLEEHGVSYTAVDNDPSGVAADRAAGHAVYYGDASNPAFLKACGIEKASAVILTIRAPSLLDKALAEIRALRPDIPIVSRARDAEHARKLYKAGVTDAVPETIEASLQLSEAALIGLGIPTGPVIATIHEQRDRFRHELMAAAKSAGVDATHAIRSKARQDG